jgi:UDP-glucose 4-epimerase/UDP-glucuronate decarboxylase
MHKDKILIVGGFGFMGYYLTSYLLHIQRNVIVFGHLPKGELKVEFDALEKKYGERLEMVDGEIIGDDLHSLVHREYNIVGVFHLAAMKSTTATSAKATADLLLNNFSVDCEVFDFCEAVLAHRADDDNRPLKLVYVSTGEIYGDNFKLDLALSESYQSIINANEASSLYPVSKIVGEMALRFSDNSFDWNIVRVQNPYGPYMPENMLIPKLMMSAVEANISGNGSFDLVAGNDSRPFVFIGDVVIGLGHVMGKAKGGEVYNLAGPDMYLDKMVRDFANKHSPNMIVYVNRGTTGTHRRMDCSKIKRDNIWEPFTTIEHGLETMYNYYHKKGLVAFSMKQIGL